MENANVLVAYKKWDLDDVFYKKAMASWTGANVVGTGNLNVKNMRLPMIGRSHFGTINNSRMFAALIKRLLFPKSTCLVYVKGVLVDMGTKSLEEAILACNKHVLLLRRYGVNCSLRGFRAYNFVFSVYTFPLDLAYLHERWRRMVQYSKKFPGACIRCNHMRLGFDTEIALEVFESGKITVTGATSEEEAKIVFTYAYFEILVHVRIHRDTVREPVGRQNDHVLPKEAVEFATTFKRNRDEGKNGANATSNTLKRRKYISKLKHFIGDDDKEEEDEDDDEDSGDEDVSGDEDEDDDDDDEEDEEGDEDGEDDDDEDDDDEDEDIRDVRHSDMHKLLREIEDISKMNSFI